jgi:CheY-like chemotaxis protein
VDDTEALQQLAGIDAVVLEAGHPWLEPARRAALVEGSERPFPLTLIAFDPGRREGLPLALGADEEEPLMVRRAGDADHLIADLSAVLHLDLAHATDGQRDACERCDRVTRTLVGKKALIVDDDIRNIFALTTALDEEGMIVVSAENGFDAIDLVKNDGAIDIVLMDIMMPELDGLATMQAIRELPRGRDLPMVAVTAKAMKGDREKCIEAGAWDYVSKPVDTAHLTTVLKGWLCR